MNKIKHMMVAVVATVIALVSNAVFAASLDLNGAARTVTDIADLAAYDGVTNSSGGNPATLTFDVATDMAYAGTISGNIKVVKAGNGMLDLSGENTYTGGTQIDDGRLVASSLTAFGATTGAIQVNSDCNGYAQGTGSTQSNNVTCVAFNCAGEFAYPINTSAWTTPSAGPNGYGGVVYYNVAVMVQGVTLSGKITGGGLSVHFGGLNWAANADLPSGSSGGLTISGDIDCGEGTCHFGSRATAINVTGKVTALGIYQNLAANWPPNWTLGHSNNSIGVIDVGGGSKNDGPLTVSAADALGGATVYSRTGDLTKSFSVKIAANQTVESFSMNPGGSYAGGSLASSDGRHYISATAAATVTMNATTDRTNDWCLMDDGAAKAMSLVWNPTGDYTYTCVGHANTINGTISVRRGTFAVGDSCSFPNVTAITVDAGAVFSNDTSVVESLKSLTALTLGAGAKAYLPADALTVGAVTLSIAPDAEVVFPEGSESVTFSDIMIGGKYLAAGSYSASGEWARVIPQIKNVATVVNNQTTGNVETDEAVWDAGGADTLLHTKENWAGDTTPNFSALPVEVTFSSGSRATADAKTLIGSITLDAPGDFTLDASSEGAIRLTGGITAADDEVSAHEYLVTAPLMLDAGQSWTFGTNANVTLAGPVTTPENTPITTEVSSYQTLSFVGTGETGYTGTWSFPNKVYPIGYYGTCIFATGENPFGGEGAVVSIAGGRQSGSKLNKEKLLLNENSNALILSNATVAATLAFPYSASEDRYGVWLYAASGSTNVVSGAVTNVRKIVIGENAQLTFNGPVSIHANDISTADALCFQFDIERSTEATKTSVVRFNGCVTFPTGSKKAADMSPMKLATYCFNAPSNVVDRVGGGNYFTIETGADYAFAEGRTAVQFRSDNMSYLKLNGHSQHIGSINSGHANTEISSTAPATLRVNQTNDVVYAGFVSSNIVFVKEGAAQLGFSKADAIKGAVRVVEGSLAPAAGALASSAQLSFEGGTLLLPEGETVVHRVDYLKNSELKSLPKGTYRAGDGSKIGSYLTGSGTLRVKTSDVKSGGLLILVR